MIICDRCQKQIPFNVIEQVSDNLIACYECFHIFIAGRDIIHDQWKVERDKRICNWETEWQRNFKQESESK